MSNTKKYFNDTHISLAHGNGGRFMRELIEYIIGDNLAGLLLDIENDATPTPIDFDNGSLMMTSDSFTVKPLEFPGGDIGSLAVHGVTNDLAVSGALPYYLSLNFILEEGLEISLFQRLLHSLANAAREVNVKIACGDTKVVPRGEGSGIYVSASAIGIRPSGLELEMSLIKANDCILVSGPIGDHGIAVMLAREQFGLRGELRSDAASVLALTQCAIQFSGLRYMRDPTRGGLATVLHELAKTTGLGVRVDQTRVPVRDAVASVCDMLGYDPYYLACEGRVVAVIAANQADELLRLWRQLDAGKEDAIIGSMSDYDTHVFLETEIGGERVLEELEDDPLPRIC